MQEANSCYSTTLKTILLGSVADGGSYLPNIASTSRKFTYKINYLSVVTGYSR